MLEMMYKVVDTADFSLQEFTAKMEADHPRLLPAIGDAAARFDSATVIRAVTYHYATTDEDRQSIIMSSLVLIPLLSGCCTARTMWLENRATQAADKNVPTRHWNIGEAHVLNNCVLVSPDLMSFGASIDKPICYCHAALAARNTVDAALAAQQMLMDMGYASEPMPVYNAGHSQGGFDALVVHRYMETEATPEERKLLPLLKTFCADGPYVPDVQTEVMSARDKYLYGAYMVMNAMSHLYYHKEFFSPEITIDDFLTDGAKELDIAGIIARKDMGNKELVKVVLSALGQRISAIFVDDACRPGGQIYEMMMDCSRADRAVDGWIPALPISFYHAHYDECVVVECMQAAEAVWGKLPNVSFEDDMTLPEDVPGGMVHAYSGGVFHRRLLEMTL